MMTTENPTLKRRKVDLSIERRILTGMIVSKSYLRQIVPIFNPNYLQNSYTKKIASWILNYYKTYDEPPMSEIKNVLMHETFDENDEHTVRDFLSSISDEYTTHKNFNADFLLDQSMTFFKKREMEIRTNLIQMLIEKNDIEGAEKQLTEYKKVAKATSGWFDPLDDSEIELHFEEKKKTFFSFPGALGSLVGPCERGWLIGIEGGFKKGKSFFLNDVAVMGMMSQLRVAIFSLEMSKPQVKDRIYKRLTGTSDDGGDFHFPIFDCKRNQDGTCKKPERTNQFSLILRQGKLPKYDPTNPYRPCSYCRDRTLKDYKIATWFETITKLPYDQFYVLDSIRALKDYFNNFLRVRCFPRFSANIKDISKELDVLYAVEGWVPDIIITDYLDIFKPEDDNATGVTKEDLSWMAHGRLAGERSAMVVTGTQVNKTGQDVETLSIQHTAKWVGKFGHVDVIDAINQSDEEKIRNIWRFNILAHRHRDFNPGETVTILQQLKTNQMYLDSEK